VPPSESEAVAKARADERAWLIERGYRVIELEEEAVAGDLSQVLDRLAQTVGDAAGQA
jgi:very-short-patch-repair endonuclease